MKIFEKFALILFCNIVLIISVLLCVMIFGWVDIRTIGNVIGGWLVGETSSKIILGVCALLIIIAIKCIFFDRGSGDPMRDRPGVLLQNENGKLLISKDTLENLVNSVTNEYKDTKDITTKVELDKDNNVNVLATIVVSNDSTIKDLSLNLQKEIKDRIKRATDLEVKEVNIRVKNTVDVKPVDNKTEKKV